MWRGSAGRQATAGGGAAGGTRSSRASPGFCGPVAPGAAAAVLGEDLGMGEGRNPGGAGTPPEGNHISARVSVAIYFYCTFVSRKLCLLETIFFYVLSRHLFQRSEP